MSSAETSPVTGKPGEPRREGVLDYVATHPDHQGRGLGRATCAAVSRYLVAQGCAMVSLLTDDWRLAAIHLYLSLGFEPVMNRDDMPERWARVMEGLGRSGDQGGWLPGRLFTYSLGGRRSLPLPSETVKSCGTSSWCCFG